VQDPRALANPKNLESYRAWGQEGVRRSGFGAIISVVTLFAPALTLAIMVFKPATSDARTWVVLVGAGFAVYLAAALGLMLFAVLRLNAWKRTHPWSPPPSRSRSRSWK
jgi:hypothetical protein